MVWITIIYFNLPEKLNLTRFREDTPSELVDKINLIDNLFQIKKSELTQGIICKKTVGASSGGRSRRRSCKEGCL